MRTTADALIGGFGAQIMVKSAQNPAGRAARGIISPLTPSDYKNLKLRAKPGALGREKFLLIAESGALTEGETGVSVSCGNAEYQLVRAQKYGIPECASHWEGILLLKCGVDSNA